MSVIQIRGLPLGDGVPKIAVPLTAKNSEELLCQAAQAEAADLLEWRADHYASCRSNDILPALARLREAVGEKPLLFTLRSAGEGGEAALADEEYAALCRAVIAQGAADAVDIEWSRGALAGNLVTDARRAGLRTIVSSHDFSATPSEDEMLHRLAAMKALGADLPKLAVWPQSEADVLALLKICETFAHQEDGSPLIAIAMGGLGRVSRVAAGLFGSALTFGAAGASSAPGQIDATQLRQMLELLY